VQTPRNPRDQEPEVIDEFLPQRETLRDEQLSALQEELAAERDARREDRFIFIVALVILFNVVFFTVMPNFGGPLALLGLELLILIPLAKRMGMQEIAAMLDRVIHRMAGKAGDGK
jgi:hypothetical protein